MLQGSQGTPLALQGSLEAIHPSRSWDGLFPNPQAPRRRLQDRAQVRQHSAGWCLQPGGSHLSKGQSGHLCPDRQDPVTSFDSVFLLVKNQDPRTGNPAANFPPGGFLDAGCVLSLMDELDRTVLSGKGPDPTTYLFCSSEGASEL